MRNDDPDELDQILNSALASYCPREHRPRIEQRVIARLSRPQPHQPWLRWAVPVPVLALAAVIVAYWPNPQYRVTLPERILQNSATVEHGADSTPAAPHPKLTDYRKRRAVRPRAEKAPMFPTPSPLTGEERALMRLAASNPEVLQNVQMSVEQGIQPLTVEPIRIAPLEKSDSMED